MSRDFEAFKRNINSVQRAVEKSEELSPYITQMRERATKVREEINKQNKEKQKKSREEDMVL